mgnify:CR=1 FL=1
MNSGQRSRIGFIGSIVTHIFILLFVSFVGLFNLSHPPANDIVCLLYTSDAADE